jgi:plastocyanin
VRSAAAALVAAALFSGDAAAATHTVTIEGMKFVPGRLEVKAGDTIVWTNKDIVPHTVTSTAAKVESGQIDGGKSWRYTVRKAGEIDYVCRFHPGMKGSILAK